MRNFVDSSCLFKLILKVVRNSISQFDSCKFLFELFFRICLDFLKIFSNNLVLNNMNCESVLLKLCSVHYWPEWRVERFEKQKSSKRWNCVTEYNETPTKRKQWHHVNFCIASSTRMEMKYNATYTNFAKENIFWRHLNICEAVL